MKFFHNKLSKFLFLFSLSSCRFSPFIFCVVLDESQNSFFISLPVKCYWGSSLIFGVPVKSWIARNFNALSFIKSSIKVCKDNIGITCNSLSSSIEMRCNRFAVSTPGSINLQKNFLVTIQNFSFEIISDYGLHSAGLTSWNRSWFQERSHLSCFNLSNKGCKFVRWEVWSISDIFFSGINKINERRSSVDFNTEIFSESIEMIFVLLLVNSGEDVILIVCSCLKELSRGNLISWTSEKDQSILFIFEDSIDCLLTEIEVFRFDLNKEDDEEENNKPHENRYRLFIL